MKTFEGDEWKHVKEPECGAMSRAAAQIQADELRMHGRITRDEWSEITDKIGEPRTKDYAVLFKVLKIAQPLRS